MVESIHWVCSRISLRSFLKANAIAAKLARSSLDRGPPVVFEGDLYWAEQLDDLDRALGVPSHLFVLQAPVEVCIARDRTRPEPDASRGARAGDHLGADAATQVYRLVAGVRRGEPVDATGSVEETVGAILSRLPPDSAARAVG